MNKKVDHIFLSQERKENTEQFPDSFSHGVFEGFWWAFITMTTVG